VYASYVLVCPCAQGYVSTEPCPYTLNNLTFSCDIYTACRYHYGKVAAAPSSGAAYNAVGKGGRPTCSSSSSGDPAAWGERE